MKTVNDLRIWLLAAVVAMAACDESGTDPAFDDPNSQESLELSVLEDEGAFDAGVTLASVVADAESTMGRPANPEAIALRLEAAASFAEARRAHLAGDFRRALDLSRAARRLVARSLIATGGLPSLEDLVERLEDVILTLDGEVVDDPDAVRAELEAILAEAQAALDAGDTVGAAAWAILGEQRLLLHRRLHRDVGETRARFEVAVAHASVALAERLIDERRVSDEVTDVAPTDVEPSDAASDVPERRNRWLAHAKRWLHRAEIHLSNGHWARAVHAAFHAQWSALKAVVLPGGITETEVELLVAVSGELLEQAKAAVGDAPTDAQLRVLNRAEELYALGVRMVEEGRLRGIAPLWRSASMSAWLMASADAGDPEG